MLGKRSAVAVIVAALFAGPSGAAAQDAWPISLELHVGMGLGASTGNYGDNSDGLIAGFLVGARLPSAMGGRMFAAASAGVQASGSVDCAVGFSQGCGNEFPGFVMTSVLAGWETSDALYRVLVGPAAVWGDFADWDELEMGLESRFDVAARVVGPVGLGGLVRMVVVPSFQDDSFYLFAFGLGLRVR
jgi:hypothetical protein